MVIGVLTAKISIPGARSLKDKRSVMRSLKDRVMHRMNVSVAETGAQEIWRTAEITFVTVSSEQLIVTKRLAELGKILSANPRFVLIDINTELL